MMKIFRLISLFFCLIVVLSCSSKYVLKTSITPSLIKIDNEVQKFDMQITFKKKIFSGMLIVQRKSNCEIRIVATTYFGPNLFDFGILDGSLFVHQCIEPMKNKQLIKLLENDFKQLFLSNRTFRKIKDYKNYKQYVTGRNFGKTQLQIYKVNSENPEQVIIKHPWIGITIQLKKLTNL